MKPRIRVAFAFFWPSFTPDHFQTYFPFVYEKYDLVPSAAPEVIFYSVFSPAFTPYGDPRGPVGGIVPGPYLRVFLTGENFEPPMDNCDFAISFSTQVDHSNHLRLPLWVYENRGWGYGPERLIKDAGTDWEKIGAKKERILQLRLSAPGPLPRRDFHRVRPIQTRRRGRALRKQYERLDRSAYAQSPRGQAGISPAIQIYASVGEHGLARLRDGKDRRSDVRQQHSHLRWRSKCARELQRR